MPEFGVKPIAVERIIKCIGKPPCDIAYFSIHKHSAAAVVSAGGWYIEYIKAHLWIHLEAVKSGAIPIGVEFRTFVIAWLEKLISSDEVAEILTAPVFKNALCSCFHSYRTRDRERFISDLAVLVLAGSKLVTADMPDFKIQTVVSGSIPFPGHGIAVLFPADSSLTLECRRGSIHLGQRELGEIVAGDGPNTLPPGIRVHPTHTNRFNVLYSEYETKSSLVGPQGAVPANLDAVCYAGLYAHLDKAFDELNHCLPEFFLGFNIHTSEIIVIPSKGISSGSDPMYPSTFYMTVSDSFQVRLLESIVHEHSHAKIRFLWLGTKLYHNSDDDVRYHHPWMRIPRPMKGVFLGVHAFVNILKLYERLSLVPGYEMIATQMFRFHFQDVGLALDEIQKHADLTESGEAFFSDLTAEYQRMSQSYANI